MQYKASRKDWEDGYTKGLDLLGFKYEEPLWKLYGEGNKLLTGIPLKEIGLHIEGQPSPDELSQTQK